MNDIRKTVAALLICTATALAGTSEAIVWLQGAQNANGSWGSTLALRDTAVVLEALEALTPVSVTSLGARAWLANVPTTNVDDAARRVMGLAPSGLAGTADSLTLLSARNAETFDAGKPNFPDGGWGTAQGFATDNLDTALALAALDAAGLNGGFAVTNASVASEAEGVHAWTIPGDAQTARILITVGGAAIQLRMTEGAPPTGAEPFFNLGAGTFLIVFPDSGLPFTAGQNYVSISNPGGGVTATYTMTASYETPSFDTRTLAEPLAYLTASQNGDGGWGLQKGTPTTLANTLRVLRTLQRYDNYRNDTVMTAALVYVTGQQNIDGSFDDNGGGALYHTALGLDVLASESACSAEAVLARGYLDANQSMNGSWGDDAYTTAMVLQANTPTPPADVDSTVQLGGLATAVARTVTFVITDCDGPDGPTAETAQVAVSFNASGVGSATLPDVSSGADWISANEDHVLRRLLPITAQACASNLANFISSDTLIGGDFNDDLVVDVEDFAILAIVWNLAGDTADVTGDGQQNQPDFDAMVKSLLSVGGAVDGCNVRSGMAAGRPAPIERLAVTALGRPDASRADINGDGWIDLVDISEFAKVHGLTIPAGLKERIKAFSAMQSKN